MPLTEYFHSIGAPNINAGASEAEIVAMETRLGGRFPDALRDWFREANGFEGEAKTSHWRFPSLQRLRTVSEISGQSEIAVEDTGHPERRVAGRDYIVVCDALIYLPFYAVNIQSDSPYYTEVLLGLDRSGPGREDKTEIWRVSSDFGTFEDLLFEHPEEHFFLR